MHRYDYSFLKKDSISGSLLAVITSIYSLNAYDNSRKEDYKYIFSELQKVAMIQSVKESNAIEGIVSTDERIKAIVTGKTEPLNHNELEIAGYRDALNVIHNGYENMELDEQNILLLHNTLLGLTNENEAGKYKSENNSIVEVFSDGTRRERFRPVEAKDTQTNMEQLLLAYKEARDDSQINQLLLIPCFILDFLCIHPFKDGNGRMSRLLTLFMMYKNGFDIGKYISFEEQINKNKVAYYDALKQSSFGWHESANNYMPFIENFLNTLYLCYKELDKRFITIDSKKVNKSNRVEAALLNSLLPVSKEEIHNLLPDVSLTTIESVLHKMIKNKQITKIGHFKDAKYIRKQS